MNPIKKTEPCRALRPVIEPLENRLLLAYTLDPGFAGDGVIDGAGGGTVVQSDDKVLAVGGDGSLHRYNVDGSVDMSFGGTGQISNPFLVDVLVSGSRILAAGAGG